MHVRTWAALFAAQAASDATAIRTAAAGTWTTRDLAGLVGSACRWLEATGFPDGRPVPALLSSSPEAVALVVAGAVSGRPIAPLSPRLTPHELGAIVAPMAAPVIVAEPAAEPVGRAVAARTARRVVLLPDLSPAGPVPRVRADPPGDAVALVLHTSGTTGVPKPVAVTQAAFAARVRRQRDVMQLRPGDVYTTTSPFHHIAGVGTMLVALVVGATVVPCPRFTVATWRALDQFRPTHAVLVPTMIETLLDEGGLRLPSLRVLMYGSAPMRPATARAALAGLPGVDLLNIYGQTEGSPLTCLDGTDHRSAAAGRDDLLATVGRPVAGVELRVDRPAAGGVGELWARGAHLFGSGPGGWLRTGDLGSIDADGYVRLVGRKGDLIIRGGENVYPAEVERVLEHHPGVREAAVVGVPDDRLGQAVEAVVVARGGPSPDPDELRAFARRRLAGFKVPTSWRFVPELPRTGVGKVARARLVEGRDSR